MPAITACARSRRPSAPIIAASASASVIPEARKQVHGYVLHDFSKADRVWLEPLLTAIADAAPYLAGDDDPGFMNRVALLNKPKKPAKDKGQTDGL